MSRDRRDRPTPAAPGDREPAGELLTAYVDGVAELPLDERHAIEGWLAADPEARADADAVHRLLGRLRALPPEYDGGGEPDWAAMERSIRHSVAAEPTRPWWRRWRWLVPAMTCATAAALAIALWPRPAAAPVAIPDRAPVPAPDRQAPPGDEVVALWLDGGELDLDLSRPGALGDVLGAPEAVDAASAPIESDELAVLPAAGLAWIDDLDDAALDRAERALASPPDPSGPASPPGAATSPARPAGPDLPGKKG